MRNVSLAGATLLIIILIYRFLPGFFSRVAILLGLVVGTLVAIPAGATNFSRIGDAAVFQLTAPSISASRHSRSGPSSPCSS